MECGAGWHRMPYGRKACLAEGAGLVALPFLATAWCMVHADDPNRYKKPPRLLLCSKVTLAPTAALARHSNLAALALDPVTQRHKLQAGYKQDHASARKPQLPASST